MGRSPPRVNARTLQALTGETDVDYHSWDQIRRRTRFFLAAGLLAAGVPTVVTIVASVARAVASQPGDSQPLNEAKNSDISRDIVNEV
jgi:hypothetical protein